MHAFFTDRPLDTAAPGETIEIAGEEARHAAVRRVRVEERVLLLDGLGTTADAAVLELAGGKHPVLVVAVRSTTTHEPPRPKLELWTAAPKHARADDMIDQLTQAGASAWVPMRCERSVVEPRTSKLDRLERIARESAKQANRAHPLRIAETRPFEDALDNAGGVLLVVASQHGGPYVHDIDCTSGVRVLVGPEGGFTEEELASARSAGAREVSFGPFVMRIETAAVAAAAVIMSAR